jgi:hypothetical protein
MDKPLVRKSLFSWLKFGGKHLPKRLLRPFALPGYHRLDEKQLVLVAEGDKRNWVNMLRGFAYAFAAGGGLFWAAFHFKEPISLSVAVIALALSFLLKYLENTIKPTRFIIFDRDKGTVSFPIPRLSGGGRVTAPWSEYTGRLVLGAPVAGEARHLLMLIHSPSRFGPILENSILGIDRPLGVWSFLVQYMDKEGPLPNVPELANCPNLTDGLKESDKDWFEQDGYGGRSDPYYDWLAELKANPELDELNADIERRRAG